MPDLPRTQSAALPGHLIRRLHQRSTKVFGEATRAAGFDLTPVQYVALDALRENAGIDQAGLAKAIAKDRATTGSVLDRLAHKGLITRQINRQDKRARHLALTPAGDRLIAAMTPVVEALQNDILPGLSPEEYQQFIALAAKATSNDE